MTLTGPPARPTIDELVVADEPKAWRHAGFDVEGDMCEVAATRIRLAGKGEQRGIVGWSLRGAASLHLDGLATRDAFCARAAEPGASARTGFGASPAAGGRHPNGVVSIDHVVVMTPDLDRTAETLRHAGFDFRRLREGATPGGSTRQAFFRMGEVILEVVQAPVGTSMAADTARPARLWGISFLVQDMDWTTGALGELLGRPRDAVQPGRRIATLRPLAGVSTAVAFITPGSGAA